MKILFQRVPAIAEQIGGPNRRDKAHHYNFKLYSPLNIASYILRRQDSIRFLPELSRAG